MPIRSLLLRPTAALFKSAVTGQKPLGGFRNLLNKAEQPLLRESLGLKPPRPGTAQGSMVLRKNALPGVPPGAKKSMLAAAKRSEFFEARSPTCLGGVFFTPKSKASLGDAMLIAPDGQSTIRMDLDRAAFNDYRKNNSSEQNCTLRNFVLYAQERGFPVHFECTSPDGSGFIGNDLNLIPLENCSFPTDSDARLQQLRNKPHGKEEHLVALTLGPFAPRRMKGLI